MKYFDLGIDLGIDLIGLFILVVGLYYKRHRRGDLLLAYITLNIGLFVTMSLLSSVRVDISVGFGLFALLSIVHLRSSTVQQQEVAYYFAVLVLGLVNGLRLPDRLTTIILDITLVAVMYFMDNRRLFTRSHHLDVVLDVIHQDEDQLIADLERRLHGQIVQHILEDIDYVRGTMHIDVRYVPDSPARHDATQPRPTVDREGEITGVAGLR